MNSLAVADNRPYESGCTPLTSDEKLTYCIQPRLPLRVGKVGLKLSPIQYDNSSSINSLFIVYFSHKLKDPTLRNTGNLICERRIPNLFSKRGLFFFQTDVL
jgi:hypothetical protein